MQDLQVLFFIFYVQNKQLLKEEFTSISCGEGEGKGQGETRRERSVKKQQEKKISTDNRTTTQSTKKRLSGDLESVHEVLQLGHFHLETLALADAENQGLELGVLSANSVQHLPVVKH